MKSLMYVASIAAVALLGVGASSARADECDQLTFLTFSAPVALPQVTLPAGTYRFVHLDCGTNPHILRVTSADGREVYATLLTSPVDRMAPTSRPEVILAEMPKGQPDAITAFFYPGDTIGDRLVYPQPEARTVHDATRQTVVAANGAL